VKIESLNARKKVAYSFVIIEWERSPPFFENSKKQQQRFGERPKYS